MIESATGVLSATRFAVLATATSDGKLRHALRQPGWLGDVVGVAGYEAIDPRAEFSWPGVWPPQLRVLHAREKLSVPPSNAAHWYAYPRAAIGRDGVLHVLWAEPNTAPPASRRDVRRGVMGGDDPRFGSVWYAQLREGKWSQPSQVFRTYDVKWQTQLASPLLIDSAGRLGIVFPADDSTGSTLVYLHAEASSQAPQWRARVWRFSGGVGYANLAAGEQGRLVIGVVKAPDFPETGRGFLYVMHSADGGSTWSSLRRISRATEEPANEPHVFWRDAMLSVVWTSQPAGHFTGGVVWSATVNADGEDVKPRTALHLSGPTNGSRVAVDVCGTVHFVVRAARPTGNTIAYARYDRNGWSPIEYPFDVHVSQPSIAAIGDTVRLIWSSVESAAVVRATLMAATMPIERGDSP